MFFEVKIMGQPKRTTIYLDDSLHKALKLKAIELEKSVSELLQEVIKHHLAEDLRDMSLIKKRKHEKEISYDAFLESLKKDDLL